jgi:4Fe-4S ferredoxin
MLTIGVGAMESIALTVPVVHPVIDPQRCEGAGDCIAVCPVNVFELRTLSKTERQALPLGARLKVLVHGGRQGFVVRADACEACGRCVRACPENAIRLIKESAGD